MGLDVYFTMVIFEQGIYWLLPLISLDAVNLYHVVLLHVVYCIQVSSGKLSNWKIILLSISNNGYGK